MDTIRTMAGRSFVCIISSATHDLQHVLSHIAGFSWINRHVKSKDTCACLHHSPYPNRDPETQKKWRTVVETELFTAQCTQLGNAQRVDESLRGVYYTLASCPEHYAIVPGTQRFRWAPAQHVEWPGGIIQAMRIWYTIEPDGKVLLHAIEQL